MYHTQTRTGQACRQKLAYIGQCHQHVTVLPRNWPASTSSRMVAPEGPFELVKLYRPELIASVFAYCLLNLPILQRLWMEVRIEASHIAQSINARLGIAQYSARHQIFHVRKFVVWLCWKLSQNFCPFASSLLILGSSRLILNHRPLQESTCIVGDAVHGQCYTLMWCRL